MSKSNRYIKLLKKNKCSKIFIQHVCLWSVTPPVDRVELFHNVLKMLMVPNVNANVDLKDWFYIISRVHNSRSHARLGNGPGDPGLTRPTQKG